MNFNRKVHRERLGFQMAPMIDILFLLLIFFMSASIFYQLETELSVSVPTADASRDIKREPGEIIINITPDGTIIVNQRKLALAELTTILTRLSKLYKGQPVIIRADKKTYHEHVIKVLNACAQCDIWNISFATLKKEKAGE